MAKALDIEAMTTAEVHSEPWRWAYYESAFREPEALAAVDPTPSALDHLRQKGLIREEDGTIRKKAWSNRDHKRTLIDLGAKEVFQPEELDPQWVEVAEDLLSDEYHDAMCDITRLDLNALKMRAVFHLFNEDYACRPHVDEPRERVVHLLYLDGIDSEEEGGYFHVLRSGDPKDLVAEYPPRANQAIIQVRTDNAWHAVTAGTGGRKAPRKLLHIIWEEDL